MRHLRYIQSKEADYDFDRYRKHLDHIRHTNEMLRVKRSVGVTTLHKSRFNEPVRSQ